MATALTVRTGNSNPPTAEIHHITGQDIASFMSGNRYATVKEELTDARAEAIATNAIEAINAATSGEEIENIKEQALAAIAFAKEVYNSVLGEMGVPCDDCPAVDVTKGTTTIRLYSPEKVEFKKTE
ncbi:MAG: hypothetical protein Q4F69_11230 [Bacteroidia bacterium]|nr:hypothetical protein [Bacteroidia bacterium]